MYMNIFDPKSADRLKTAGNISQNTVIKKYWHVSLFPNNAFSHQAVYFVFIVSHFCTRMKLNDTKFDIFGPN